jgi:energy-coupling factor transporter ATP-binding protein EcfA2
VANFTASQLKEIAAGLEASGHQFRRRKKRVKKTRKIVYLKDLRKEWKAKGYYQRMDTPSFDS